jgi:hypothetical protein
MLKTFDPDEIIKINVSGTECQVKVLGYRDLMRLRKAKLGYVQNDNDADYEAMIDILSRYIVNLPIDKPVPGQTDIKAILKRLTARDFSDLLLQMINISWLGEAEEKNS